MSPCTRRMAGGWCILSLTLVLAAAPAGAESARHVSAGDRDTVQAFVAERLFSPDAARLPYRFLVDGKSSEQLLPEWTRSEQSESLDAGRTRRVVQYTDPKSGLAVRCEAVVYRDFPTVEWKLLLRNTGTAPTPLVEAVQPLDTTWQRGDDAEFLLHHAVGSQAGPSDYGPIDTPLPPGAVQRYAGAGGRPTNKDWSYFNLQWGDRGVIVVVGWPGQWAGEFARDAGRGLRVRAGQEVLRARLEPGEEIRTPLMVLQFWSGRYEESQNVWRRWMMAYGMPHPGGKLPPPQCVASSSRAYEEMIHANEQNQILHIDRYLEEGFKLDYWWMDAGWYIQSQGWPQVGTWEVDPARFPKGFRPISDHAHQRGVKILVWFEPERVTPDTWLYDNHPEWLLRAEPRNPDLADIQAWTSQTVGGTEPNVTHNAAAAERSQGVIRWAPGGLAFHPGGKGEYSVVRWTAPEAGEYAVEARFLPIDPAATTSVYVAHGSEAVFEGNVDSAAGAKSAEYRGRLAVARGATVDFVVGWGNGTHVCDSTGLEARITSPAGTVFDAAAQFHPKADPESAWSYGYLPPAPAPDGRAFLAYDRSTRGDQRGTRLLNLGDPAARQWLIEHIDGLLTREGIDLYRQDFNMDPLAFWRLNDEPDRQGITENRYVCGYLAYWDELRRRHPDMLIDSCASGGRRNDLETMRRAVPLWRSDYAYEAVGHQCMTYGISLWLPYHGTGTVASAAAPYYGGGLTAVEPYAFWSNTAPSLGLGVDIRERGIDYATLRRLYQAWRALSRFYTADFYPLTPYTQDRGAWIAWQFHDPEHGRGAIQAFRRPECAAEEVRLALRDLDPQATYVFEPLEGLALPEATGADLMAGLRLALPERPAAAVMLYHRKDVPPPESRL